MNLLADTKSKAAATSKSCDDPTLISLAPGVARVEESEESDDEISEQDGEEEAFGKPSA